MSQVPMEHPRDDSTQVISETPKFFHICFCTEAVLIAKFSLCTQPDADKAKRCSYISDVSAVLNMISVPGF